MRLEHNLEPEELVMALSGTILAEGLGEDVIDTLSKSKAGGGEEPLEPELIALIKRWQKEHKDLLERIDTNLNDWFVFKKQLAEGGVARRIIPFFLVPYKPGLRRDPGIDDVREASWLIMDHYRLASGFGTRHWESPYGPMWEKAGLTTPMVDLADLATKAYMAGRGLPLGTNREDVHASVFAAAHAGTFITGVGNRMGTIMLQKGLATLAETYHDTIANHLMEHLQGQDPEESGSWERLAAVLRQVVGEADLKRDMDRIAHTELRWAYNVGRIQYMVETGVTHLYYIVQPGACAQCKRLYLHRDGRPKVFQIGTVLKDIARWGGLNAYRSTRQLRPSALVHPYCHCTPVAAQEPVPEVYKGITEKTRELVGAQT